MSSCITDTCGTGDWTGPLPGDPDNNVTLSAVPAFGGIDVSWTYPSTNPHAVAHVILYRGVTANYAASVKQATVSGNTFYDRITGTAGLRYYYWIQIVSVNGTVSAAVGPASAIARTRVEDLMQDLTGQIDSGLLAASLKGEIENISINYDAIIAEVDARMKDNSALSSALGLLNNRVNAVDTFVVNEITQRKDGDNALVQQISILAAANEDNTALISEERTVRVTATDALSQIQLALDAQLNDPMTGLPATRGTLLSDYYTKTKADEAIAASTFTLNTSVFDDITGLEATRSLLTNDYYTKSNTDSAISKATLSLVSQTNLDTTLKNYTDTSGLNTRLAAYTNTAALTTNYYTKTDADDAIANATVSLASKTSLTEYAKNDTLKDYTLSADLKNDYLTKTDTTSAISTAATTLQVVGPDGTKAALQQTMTTQYSLNKGYSALYGMKLTNDGLIGGFGLANDGITVQAGFDVDSFWIGRTNTEKVKPFIIDKGVTYIDSAMISKLKADQIDTTGLQIKDSTGNLIFSSGGNLDWSRVTGDGKTAVLKSITDAQDAADSAAGAALLANDALADIANDNILTPGEKPKVLLEYNTLTLEHIGINAQADLYVVSHTAYNTALMALVNYMATLPGWNTIPGGNVPIVGSTFRNYFGNLYAERQKLLNAIATKANVLTGVAATTANWSGVSGTGKPADYADVTADNTAAGIAGQGALATKSAVKYGTDITLSNGTVINDADFVHKLSKISAPNGANPLSNFMDNLAIGNAYIGNASVSTLKISGNAVTVPSSGISGCSLTLTEPGYVFVSASAWMYENSGSNGGAVTAAFSMQINCSNGGVGGYVNTHSARARHITASTGECFYLGAGSWSFYVSTSDIEGSYTYMGGYITAVGAMR